MVYQLNGWLPQTCGGQHSSISIDSLQPKLTSKFNQSGVETVDYYSTQDSIILFEETTRN